ncbi:MAG: YgiT-type zinc finger protein, partial [Candidatus Deferrimicrobium sp.]
GCGSEDEEETMKCHVCGGEMRPIVTDLPFKVSTKTIVILKELPVLQCERCSEYVLEDRILERVDVMLGKVDDDAELKVLKFAA